MKVFKILDYFIFLLVAWLLFSFLLNTLLKKSILKNNNKKNNLITFRTKRNTIFQDKCFNLGENTTKNVYNITYDISCENFEPNIKEFVQLRRQDITEGKCLSDNFVNFFKTCDDEFIQKELDKIKRVFLTCYLGFPAQKYHTIEFTLKDHVNRCKNGTKKWKTYLDRLKQFKKIAQPFYITKMKEGIKIPFKNTSFYSLENQLNYLCTIKELKEYFNKHFLVDKKGMYIITDEQRKKVLKHMLSLKKMHINNKREQKIHTHYIIYIFDNMIVVSNKFINKTENYHVLNRNISTKLPCFLYNFNSFAEENFAVTDSGMFVLTEKNVKLFNQGLIDISKRNPVLKFKKSTSYHSTNINNEIDFRCLYGRLINCRKFSCGNIIKHHTTSSSIISYYCNKINKKFILAWLKPFYPNATINDIE